MEKKTRTYKLIQFSILTLILIVFVVFFVRHAEEMQQIVQSIRFEWLPLVIFFLVLNSFVSSFLWAYLIRHMGCSLSYKRLIIIWYYSLIGLYVPGSVWMMVGRAYQLHKAKVSKTVAVFSIVLEQVFTLAVGFFLILITPEVLRYIQIPFQLGLILAPFTLVVCFPHFFGNLIWKLGIRRVDLRKIPRISFNVMLTYFLGLWLSRYIIGVAILVMLKLFQLDVPSLNVMNAAGMASASFVIGYLSFLTPSGIGVKEGVLAFLLSNHFSLPIAILFSVSCRLWAFLAHGIGILIAFLYGRKQNIVQGYERNKK